MNNMIDCIPYDQSVLVSQDTAEDVKDVIWEVQRRVKERFQVDLEPEIKFL